MLENDTIAQYLAKRAPMGQGIGGITSGSLGWRFCQESKVMFDFAAIPLVATLTNGDSGKPVHSRKSTRAD